MDETRQPPIKGSRKRARKPQRTPTGGLRGKVRAHDPFELIRWLAYSQPDPRKALAELVQNSLDAESRHVRVTRIRERGIPCLKIFDDGEGVIPELERTDALKYIATHIGHSRKRSLSPQERLTLMTQGQYGIGLLGFWSLGERLEIRTSVPGQSAYRLILHRDRPDFLIEKLRGRLDLDERWTEVVVAGIHKEAQSALIGRRAADYLAAELRGQLLHREVDLLVEDRMSRGRAPKEIRVRPPRFLGERLEGIGPLEVEGFPQIRLEIYLVGDASNDDPRHGLAVYAAGTLVSESFEPLAGLGLDHSPWTDPRLTGIVDFPVLRVSPGSRRGIFIDEAATAFAGALRSIEPILTGVLDALDRRRAEELDRSMIRDLQRAFRGFYRQSPRYALLPVARAGDESAGVAGDSAAAPGVAESARPDEEARRDEEEAPARPAVTPLDLLPPGPLESVRVTPSPLHVAVGGSKRVRAVAVDVTGRGVDGAVSFRARIVGMRASVQPMENDDGMFTVHAESTAGSDTLHVDAVAGERRAETEIAVEILDELGAGRSSEGIPEPELVNSPGAPWRSRMNDGTWEVNTGHRDYRAVVDKPAQKLRYLAMLFAKEVVLRSNQDARLDRPLEQLVEVAAYADRNLSKKTNRRRAKKVP
jgi:hypothetical protein